MYRFALRPKWILSHLFALGLAALFIFLGFWQLRRLDERRAFNDQVTAALDLEPVVPAPGETPPEWTRVLVRGEFVPGTDVLVANRAENDQTGFWVLTQFKTADITLVVSRGFLGRALQSQNALADSPPPPGQVEVLGVAQKSRSGAFARNLDDGATAEMNQVDVAKLSDHWGVPLESWWVQSSVAQGPLLTAVADPELNDGPHLGYALQWFAFATIGMIGYPLTMRRVAKNKAIESSTS